MVQRHLIVPYDFLCITDDPKDVNCRTVKPEGESQGWWTKLTLFKDKPYGIEGPILYLDLDIVILENIDDLAKYNSDFIIIQDWSLPMYNSSVFKLESGSRQYVWDSYIRDSMTAQKTARGGDQHWITLKAKGEVWPEDWVLSYKKNNRKQEGKIVVFHGVPNPHECNDWVKDQWV